MSIGKLKLASDWPTIIDRELDFNGITWLPVTKMHCQAVASLPFHHRDPFDRMLVAQAQTEQLTLLSDDPLLSAYEVLVDW